MKLPSLNPSSLPALLFLLSLPAIVTPLYFHIGDDERKCFIEDIPDGTAVVGDYNVEPFDPRTSEGVSPLKGMGTHLEVRDPATIAIPLAMLTLLIVGLIAGYIFHQKRKDEKRPGSETVDENPIYGEEMYMRDETGGMRQTTITVTDSSPFYGGSTGEWDGAYVTDFNEYYA